MSGVTGLNHHKKSAFKQNESRLKSLKPSYSNIKFFFVEKVWLDKYLLPTILGFNKIDCAGGLEARKWGYCRQSV